MARSLLVALGCLALVAWCLALPGRVSAHERRDVLNGHYQLTVGWQTEPAYDHQLNALDLTVVDKTQKGDDGKDKPVQDLDQTLKVEILSGGTKMALKLQPNFGFPGKYLAPVVPTKPGLYSFHIFGTIEGQALDERFDSGPNTFDDVTALAALQFPPDGAAAPAAPVPTSAAPTATKVPQSSGVAPTSQSAAVPATAPPATVPPVAQQPVAPAQPPPAAVLPAEYQARLDAAQGAADSARTDARGARVLGIGGLVVGTLGLTAAILALVRRPGRVIPVPADADDESEA